MGWSYKCQITTMSSVHISNSHRLKVTATTKQKNFLIKNFDWVMGKAFRMPRWFRARNFLDLKLEYIRIQHRPIDRGLDRVQREGCLSLIAWIQWLDISSESIMERYIRSDLFSVGRQSLLYCRFLALHRDHFFESMSSTMTSSTVSGRSIQSVGLA